MTTQPSERTGKIFTARALKVAGFTAIAGPLVGTLVVMLVPFASAALHASIEAFAFNSLVEIGEVLLFVGVFGYVFGGLPAILAGVASGAVVLRYGSFGYGVAMLVGALSGLIGGLLLSLATLSPGEFALGLQLFLAPFSAAAAVICRWLMGFFRILPHSGNVSLAKH